MATQLQIRRGTAAQVAAFTGAEGEIVYNSTNDSLHTNDGATAGGFELARADLNNVSDADLNAALTGNTLSALTITTLTAGAATFSGEITANGGIALGDNDKATFGAGSDLQIYHNGSYSAITDVGTGAFYIGGADFVDIGNSTLSETSARFYVNDRVDLYHDNAVKLSTTSTGIDVTGTVTADGLTSSGIIEASDGTNGEMQFGLGTALTTGAGTYDSSVRWNGSAGNLLFSQGAVEKMRITAAGIDVTGAATFSSSVTAVGNIQTNSVGGVSAGARDTKIGTNASSAAVTWYDGVNVFATDGTYEIKNTSSKGLSLAPVTGAATFNGNVGIGVAPSAWGASTNVIDLNTGAAIYGTNSGVGVAGNLYYSGASWIAKNTGGGTLYSSGSGGEHYWYSSASVTGGTTAGIVLKASISSAGALSCPAWYTNTTALAATAYIATGPQGEIYRSTSSIKYKRDVETIEDAYADALLDVRPVFYRSKSDNDNSAHGFWGIIAEELAEIDPRLVHWQTHVPVEVTDDDGVVTTEMVELDTPEPEGVQYERFVPHLINLAKRQRDQMTAQASAIEALTARLEALEGA